MQITGGEECVLSMITAPSHSTRSRLRPPEADYGRAGRVNSGVLLGPFNPRYSDLPSPRPDPCLLLQIQQRIFLHSIHLYLKVNMNTCFTIHTSCVPHPCDILTTRYTISNFYI